MVANVRKVYRQYLSAIQGEANAATGRMEVELEIEQRIRLLREIEGTSLIALSKIEVLTTLETVLNSLGERELVERTYDFLDEWRVTRMVGTESSSADAAPVESDPLDQGSPSSPHEDQSSQTLVSPPGERTVEMRVDPDEADR